MPRMIGRAAARNEVGARAEPALYTGVWEGEDDGAGCGIRGVEWTGTGVGAT